MAFSRYIAAIYADQFDSYAGEQLTVIGERTYGADVIVQTRIVKATGEFVTIDYRMQRDGQSWLIEDVYLDGTISQLAVQRPTSRAARPSPSGTASCTAAPLSPRQPASMPRY